MSEAVDWKIGEVISIASTDYNGRHGEKRWIKAVDRTNPDKPVITLN